MTDTKEKAAGVVQTPAAANNVIRLENGRSVLHLPARRKPAAPAAAPAPVARIDPDGPERLLANAWALLPIRAKGAPLTRFMLHRYDTQAQRTYFAELLPDLSMRIVEAGSGQVVCVSAPLAPTGTRGPKP
ncbi:hypothetical protein [Ottowia oryzae]|uniref:Uncharacterized protein n=1 Tax=Ottowia oryzae TaxID=2109914 RepID=A0A2S0MHL6_9BURK|nr:hypothetical protein [Ottowia oryzae]AVO35369.1 hypothetical protein C6570_14900 [Ottowia oryzae]